MDRRTLLAVVISVVIIVLGMVITPLIVPPKPDATPAPTAAAQPPAESSQPSAAPGSTTVAAGSTTAASTGAAAATGTTAVSAVAGTAVPLPDSAPPASQPRTIQRDTDIYTMTFDTAGATLASLKPDDAVALFTFSTKAQLRMPLTKDKTAIADRPATNVTE